MISHVIRTIRIVMITSQGIPKSFSLEILAIAPTPMIGAPPEITCAAPRKASWPASVTMKATIAK